MGVCSASALPRVPVLSRMGPSLVLVDDPRHAARLVVDEIDELSRLLRGRNKSLVLGLATGRTPVAVYDEIVGRVEAGRLDLEGAIAFNLDEYCGLASGDSRSFAAWMRAKLFDRIRWPAARVHIPSGDIAPSERERHCAEYEAAIRAAGGIDLQLLGLGRNGHIGFNEPGSARESRTRCVRLARETLADAAADFGGVAVPQFALTMGIGTILEARRVRLLAFGEQKRPALRRALTPPADPQLPASFLLQHPDARFFVDAAALGPDRAGLSVQSS